MPPGERIRATRGANQQPDQLNCMGFEQSIGKLSMNGHTAQPIRAVELSQ